MSLLSLSLEHTHKLTCCFKTFCLPHFDMLLLIGFSSSLCSSLSCICTLMLCLIHMRRTHSRCEKRKSDSKSAFFLCCFSSLLFIYCSACKTNNLYVQDRVKKKQCTLEYEINAYICTMCLFLEGKIKLTF